MTALLAALFASRIAVAVTGGGTPEGDAALQSAAESAAAGSAGVTVVRGGETVGSLVPVRAMPVHAPLDPAAAAEAKRLFDEATAAYYDDKAVVAIEKLGAVAALHEKNAAFPATERVRVRFWKATVALALDDRATATREVQLALAIIPDTGVDTAEFRPSLRELVDAERPKLKLSGVNVTGLPPGSVLEVDGRPVTSPFQVAAGSHHLWAAAPGFRAADRVFTSEKSVTVEAPLALALPAELDAALAAAATSGKITGALRKKLAALTPPLAADWLLAVGTGAGKVRALWIPVAGGDGVASSPWTAAEAPVSLPGWVARSVKQLPAPGAASAAAHAAGGVAVAAGLDWATRTRHVGDRFDAPFTGAGPRLGATWSRGGLLAVEGDLAYTQYAVTSLEVTLPDGASKQIAGGSTLATGVRAGVHHVFGAGDEAGDASVSLTAGPSYEDHTAVDVKDANGKYGLLPSHTRLALDVRAGVRVPIAPKISLVASALVSPWSAWTERPSGTTGKDPKPGLAAGGTIGAAWTNSRVTATLEAGASQRSVAFSGTGSARVTPALQDETVQERYTRIGASLSARF